MEKAQNKDVVVIGGGAIGVSAAYYLAQQGREVTVLDKGEIGRGASCGNAGLLVPSHIIPLAAPGVVAQGIRWLFNRSSPFYIRPRLDRALLRWLWRFWRFCTETHVDSAAPILRDLSLQSIELFGEIDTEEGIADFGFERSGLLMLHQSEDGCKKNAKDAGKARALGLKVTEMDAAALHELEPNVPDGVQGGFYYHQDGLVDPAAFVSALREDLEQKGASFCPWEAVEGFETTGGAITAIQTSRRKLRPHEVVLAAGAWSAQLGQSLELRLPVQPAKGYSLTYPSPEAGPRIPFILNEEKISATPLGGRLRFGGTLELAGFDGSIDEHRLMPLQRVARQYVDDGHAGSAQPWMGYRPCTPDGLPIIGRSEAYTNLVLATGHAMIGISLAPITGKLVSELITEKPLSVDIAPLSLRRFT